jgi:hypothetical protein
MKTLITDAAGVASDAATNTGTACVVPNLVSDVLDRVPDDEVIERTARTSAQWERQV